MKIGSGRTVILAALLAVALAFFLSGIWVEPEQRIRPTGRLPSILLVTVEGQCALNLSLQCVSLLDVSRKAHQNLVQHTARLTGRYHVAEQVIEHVFVPAQRIGQR